MSDWLILVREHIRAISQLEPRLDLEFCELALVEFVEQFRFVDEFEVVGHVRG